MPIFLHVLICFLITVSNVYAFDLSQYKDNKGNSLEYQYYLLTKKDKDYIRLIPKNNSEDDIEADESIIAFYGNIIKHTYGIYDYEYTIKNIKVKDNVFYIDIEWSLDGEDYKDKVTVSYIDSDKIKVTFLNGNSDLIYTNQPNNYKLFRDTNSNEIKEIEGTIINTPPDKK